MIRAGFIIAGFAATLAVSPALACSPAPMKPSSKAIRGENCAVSWQVSEYGTVGISAARPVAPGFVWQETYEGNACNGVVTVVVQDCRSGQVLLLGEAFYDLMQPETSKRLDELLAQVEKAGAKPGFGLSGAQALAEKRGLTRVRAVTTADRIHMSGKSVRLDCGCKTLFPEMEGKG
ncbi:hypothetical protein [Pseudogemmobacter bohemicus]|uniref:hypothetical protein n=1 Tax=Pseudogemmobacter bohemicus TaxID=2250708 RepID=UPI000DD33FC8|nr:hypothetical protein [Pseudogemmobacter bohemicus]